MNVQTKTLCSFETNFKKLEGCKYVKISLSICNDFLRRFLTKKNGRSGSFIKLPPLGGEGDREFL